MAAGNTSPGVFGEGLGFKEFPPRVSFSNPNAGVTGGIIVKDMPINISNIGLYNPETKKADRVGFRFLEDGKKVRYFKSTNEVVDV